MACHRSIVLDRTYHGLSVGGQEFEKRKILFWMNGVRTQPSTTEMGLWKTKFGHLAREPDDTILY